MSTPDTAPVAALVTVGDELLLGETLDANGAWLGRELSFLGFVVRQRQTVGDEAADIQDAVQRALPGADLVVVTGGLGPTPDDVTREAVAGLCGRPLREDGALLEHLERRFRDRGYARMPEPNRTQALVPEGGRVLTNTRGTAPGLALEHGGATIVLLPGVPHEMRGIFQDVLRGLLEERFQDRLAPVSHRTLHTAGIPESRLAEIVQARLPVDLGRVSIAFLPDPLGVDLRLSARGPGDVARSALEEVERQLAPALGSWLFDAPSGDLAEAVIARLRTRASTLAVAESCTGGLLGHRVTAVPGASDVFLGGVVAYADRVKIDLLGVDAGDIEREGAVSEVVARSMALGARERFGAGAGVAITGIAGPGGGSPEKPVGTVWCAVAVGDNVSATLMRLPGDRVGIQRRAAQEALRMLHGGLA